MGINIWKEMGIKTNEMRVGLSEIKELSKSSVKATRAITIIWVTQFILNSTTCKIVIWKSLQLRVFSLIPLRNTRDKL